MFIMFIETVIDKFLDVVIGEFVVVATCCYHWRHVAGNSNGAVV